MKKYTNFLFIFLTGCQNQIKSSSNSKSSTTSNTTQKTTSKKSIVSNVNSTTNYSANSNIVISNTVGTPIKSSIVIQTGSVLYYCNWSDGGKIYKIKADGTSNTKVSEESFIKFFSVDGSYVYFGKKTDIGPTLYKVSK